MADDKNCGKTWIYKDQSGRGLCKSRYRMKDGAQEIMYSCKIALKLPRKRKSLTVRGGFAKIIDVGKAELCFLDD
jgi:hypothetical protein